MGGENGLIVSATMILLSKLNGIVATKFAVVATSASTSIICLAGNITSSVNRTPFLKIPLWKLRGILLTGLITTFSNLISSNPISSDVHRFLTTKNVYFTFRVFCTIVICKFALSWPMQKEV